MKSYNKLLLVTGISSILASCTISVVDTHTENGSSESVTETQKTDPKIKGAIQVPIKSEVPVNITPAPKK